MIIKTLRLENVGDKHRDATINFERGTTAITGVNGSGKSFIVDSIFAALYGKFPSRGHVKRSIGPWGDSATITMEFEHHSVEYKVKRIATSGGTEASIEYDGRLIGPKVKPVDHLIESIVGPSFVALATWFADVEKTGDIVKLEESQRRALMGKLLDFDRYEKIARLAASAANEAKTQISYAKVGEKEQALAGKRSQKQDLKDELLGTVEQLDSHGRLVQEYGKTIDGLEKRLQHRLCYEGIVREAEAARASLNQAAASQTRIEQLGPSRVAEIEAKLEMAKAQQALIPRRKALLSNLEAKEKAIAEAEDKRKKLLADMMTDSEFERSKIKASYYDESKYQDIRIKVQRLESEVAEHQHWIKRTSADLADVKAFKESKPCGDCAFADLYANRAKRAEELESALAQKQMQLISTQSSLDSFRLDLDKMTTALPFHGVVKREEQNREAANTIKAKLEELKQDIDIINESINLLPTIQEMDVKAIASELAAEKKADEERAALSRELENVPEWRRILDGFTFQDTGGHGSKELEKMIQDQRFQCEMSQKEIQRLLIHQARCDTEFNSIEENIATLESQIQDAKDAEAKLQWHKSIAMVFGAKGIQPILIDTIAAPEIERIVGEYLDEVMGERFKISTLSTLQSGDTSESFEFLISKDGLNWRAIETFSSGEQATYRLCIRLALNTWLRGKGGASFPLILDEAFEYVSEDRKSKLLKLITSQDKGFDQVIIISHDDWLAPQMQTQINLS